MSYSNQTILLTGATGFLGTHIKSNLDKIGFKVITLGRKNAEIVHDLGLNIPKLSNDIHNVIHVAGRAHSIPKTEKEVLAFYTMNYDGTVNLLEGIKQSGSKIKSFIFISSVAVYGLNEGVNIDETHPLKANDPYGKSKLLAEEAVINYCTINQINYCILRLPLIAGKNPPGNLGSMINAIKKGWYLSIGKADAKKSMVLADDVAKLIPQLFDKIGIYNLTDGYHPSFGEIETVISRALNKKKIKKIPQFLAKVLAMLGDILGKNAPINSKKLRKIQSHLTFSDMKAKKELNWQPSSVLHYLSSLKYEN